MRIRIAHSITHRYDQPVRAIAQVLRLVPSDNDGQQIGQWRVSPSVDGRLRPGEDAYGNRLQRFEADGPLDELTIQIEGVVDTFDTAGIFRGAIERVPVEVFLRQTTLTEADEAVVALADAVSTKRSTPLDRLHRLLGDLHGLLKPSNAAGAAPVTAAACLRDGRGLPQDLAHVFVAAARHMEIPARCVSGYRATGPEGQAAETLHGWAEAHVEGLGWVGFDVAAGQCPSAAHVRLAAGLDHAEIAPVRWARSGGGREALSMAISVTGNQ